MTSTPTLFDKYGGFDTIYKIVCSFYDRVLEVDSLAHFFQDVNMERLINHQTTFIGMVMGGPANQYSGRDLSAAHAHLRITESDFALVASILQQTLTEHGVETDDVEVMMKAVASAKTSIVTT